MAYSRWKTTALVLCVAAATLGIWILRPHAATSSENPKKSPEQLRAAYEAHQGDFDYLLGDWRYTAKSREYGEFNGLWSAARLPGGQIIDEWVVLNEKGETVYATSTIRAYNSALDRWELVGMDRGSGLQDIGTGQVQGKEVHIEQVFGANGDAPLHRRIRYFNIQPDRFSWVSDASRDGGKTWQEDDMSMEVQRIGPARSLSALTQSRR